MRTHQGFRGTQKSPPGYLARLEQRRSRDVRRSSLDDGSPAGREKPAEIQLGAAMKRHQRFLSKALANMAEKDRQA